MSSQEEDTPQDGSAHKKRRGPACDKCRSKKGMSVRFLEALNSGLTYTLVRCEDKLCQARAAPVIDLYHHILVR